MTSGLLSTRSASGMSRPFTSGRTKSRSTSASNTARSVNSEIPATSLESPPAPSSRDTAPQSEKTSTILPTLTELRDETERSQAGGTWQPKLLRDKKLGDSKLCIRLSLCGPEGWSKKDVKLSFVADYRERTKIKPYWGIFLIFTMRTGNGNDATQKFELAAIPRSKCEEDVEKYTGKKPKIQPEAAVGIALRCLKDKMRWGKFWILEGIQTAEAEAKRISLPASQSSDMGTMQKSEWVTNEHLKIVEAELYKLDRFGQPKVQTDNSAEKR